MEIPPARMPLNLCIGAFCSEVLSTGRKQNLCKQEGFLFDVNTLRTFIPDYNLIRSSPRVGVYRSV